MDKSRLFTPPQDHVPESDPAIIRIPMKEMDWAARRSQQKGWDNSGGKGLKHIPNGR